MFICPIFSSKDIRPRRSSARSSALRVPSLYGGTSEACFFRQAGEGPAATSRTTARVTREPVLAISFRPLARPMIADVFPDAPDRVDPEPVLRIGGVAADRLEGLRTGDLEASRADLVTAQNEPPPLGGRLVDEGLQLFEAHVVASSSQELAEVADQGIVARVVPSHPAGEEPLGDHRDVCLDLPAAPDEGLAAGIGEAHRLDAEEIEQDPVLPDDL